jgi:hypothetical protein
MTVHLVQLILASGAFLGACYQCVAVKDWSIPAVVLVLLSTAVLLGLVGW